MPTADWVEVLGRSMVSGKMVVGCSPGLRVWTGLGGVGIVVATRVLGVETSMLAMLSFLDFAFCAAASFVTAALLRRG